MTGPPATEPAGIALRGVTLSFPLLHGAGRSLKKAALDLAIRRLGQDHRRRAVVNALCDLSFSVQAGERLALIGGNGAGKTTLLRVLAGIYEPDAGAVTISGRVGALLDPGLGMHQDLTGRENVHLRGLLHGLSGAPLRRMEAEVADFAGLDTFLDLPLRTYSAGMAVRLGFALATAIRPDLVLMDEWFLAGDAAFRSKAQGRLAALVRQAEILVLATHEPDIVRTWCTRTIWLEEGRIRADGRPDEILAAYARAADAQAPGAEAPGLVESR